MSTQRGFFNRRLHSLLGVIPVGFFLIEHMFTNYTATGGAQAFVDQVKWLWNLPFLVVMEILFIILPLMYHGIYGLYIAFRAQNNTSNFGTFRNYMFVVQRVTGVITLIFVTWHVLTTRVQVALHHYSAVDLAYMMHDILRNPIYLTLYLIGLLSALFHFSNGMWSFLVSWGITIGPRSQRVSTWVWMIMFVALAYMGVTAVFAFANPDFVNHLARY